MFSSTRFFVAIMPTALSMFFVMLSSMLFLFMMFAVVAIAVTLAAGFFGVVASHSIMKTLIQLAKVQLGLEFCSKFEVS